jgi:hypothetical protein
MAASGPFVLDDLPSIAGNPTIRQMLNIPAEAFGSPDGNSGWTKRRK